MVVLASLGTLCASTSAWGIQRVDNFVLLDHTGKAQELYYNSDATAVVLVAQSNSCPLDAGRLDALNAISAANPSVQVMMVNSLDSRAAISQQVASSGSKIAVLSDSAQIIGQSLELKTAGEALVINPANWEIVYRGPVDEAALKWSVAGLTDGRSVEPMPAAAQPE